MRERREGWLNGVRALVPPSRVAVHHPLAGLLARAGAEVVVFPKIAAAPPPDPAALHRAAARLGELDWVVVAGRLAAENLLEALPGGWPTPAPAVAAIGSGAIAVMRDAGLEPLAPGRHTADAVAAALGEVSGRRVLLVRGADASDELPARLRADGAEVVALAGFAVRVEVARESAEAALSPLPATVVLANPTAARLLDRAARELGLDFHRRLAGALVAAAGPATAGAAAALGLPAGLVADGHLKGLVRALEEHFQRG